jgi:hypothetical protein
MALEGTTAKCAIRKDDRWSQWEQRKNDSVDKRHYLMSPLRSSSSGGDAGISPFSPPNLGGSECSS